jgi:hypothetical protein
MGNHCFNKATLTAFSQFHHIRNPRFRHDLALPMAGTGGAGLQHRDARQKKKTPA